MKEIAVSLFSIIIFQFASFYAFGKLSGKKMHLKKVNIPFIILFPFVQIFFNKINLRVSGSLITVVYFYFMYKRIFKCTRDEAKNYGILIWGACLLYDLLMVLILATFGLTKFYETHEFITKTICSLSLSLVVILTFNCNIYVKHLRKAYNSLCKMKINIKYIYMIIITFIFLNILELSYIKDNTLVRLTFIIGMLGFVLITVLISKSYKIMVLKLTNKILEENNLTNKKVITEYSILKHNFESKLLGIRDIANKEAKVLIDDLLEDTNSSVYIKNDINAMPLGINGLVMGKLAKHEKSNINISITNDIKSNILEVVSPRSYNLFCEALGVSLDNALESAKNTKEKIVYLEFKETSTEIKLIVINTFSGGVDLDCLGEVNYTSKKKGHGLGLYSLFRKNLNIKTTIKNNLFINDISIKKRKAKSE